MFLRASTIVGRGDDCRVRIDRPSVSTEHAIIRWTSRGWVLRDMHSRNGTLHNGNGVVPPATVVLSAGDVLAFGEQDERWEVIDDQPPGLLLEAPPGSDADPVHVSLAAGMRALPSEDDPQVTLMYEGGPLWLLEDRSGERRPLRNNEAIKVGGLEWIVSVPGGGETTADAKFPIRERTVKHARFVLTPSPDEESASAVVSLGGEDLALRAAVALYLLVFLARERLKDPDGWVTTDEACEELDLQPENLAVQVHRVRKAVHSIGLVDAAKVIERQRGKLRIGVPASNLVVM